MYIPVGTRLEYTASYRRYSSGIWVGTSWTELASKLKNDLPNLQGMEELDVETSNGSTAILPLPSNNETISLRVLNNGVEHADENDVKSLIDGTIQGYGIQLISSDITNITLPGDRVISTGAQSNAPATIDNSTANSGFNLGSLFGSIGTGTKLLTSGTIIIIVIMALVLLFPASVLKLMKGK